MQEMTELLDIKVTKIYKLNEDQPLKAFVDMSINDVLLIRGIRVVEGKHGLFVSMPREQGKDKKWYDQIRCLNSDVRTQINAIVLNAYQTNLN